MYHLSMLFIHILTFIHSEFNVFLSGNKLISRFVEKKDLLKDFYANIKFLQLLTRKLNNGSNIERKKSF